MTFVQIIGYRVQVVKTTGLSGCCIPVVFPEPDIVNDDYPFPRPVEFKPDLLNTPNVESGILLPEGRQWIKENLENQV